jgi:hypothetical protein
MDGTAMTALIAWLQDNLILVGAVAFLLFLAIVSNRRGPKRGVTDSQRLFTVSQKAEAGVRSGSSRCEHKHPIWFRCRARGSHGDHIYPHSRGGATSMSNLQLLCPTHNLRKSAKVPSSVYIWRLEQRRARYFPAGVSGKVEWRIGRAS